MEAFRLLEEEEEEEEEDIVVVDVCSRMYSSEGMLDQK